MSNALTFLACMLPPALAACSSAAGPAGARPDPDHSAAIARAAAEYTRWGVVGPHVSWAPALCRSPPPPAAHATSASDLAEDGHKLFALYASDAPRYLTLTAAETADDAPVGLTVVKESYAPRPVPAENVPEPWSVEARSVIDELGFYPYATKGGASYGVGARQDLFVMMRLAPDTPGTDAGWIYGTVAPDGAVTSSGVVASCVACHRVAPHDRLFGVPF
jgi:hypothetical protein